MSDGDLLSGVGTVTFSEDSLCSHSFGIRAASGEFVDGKLEGTGVIEYNDGSFMRASFRAGVIHGMARKFRCKFGACDLFERESWSDPKHLWEVIKRPANQVSLSIHFKAFNQ